MVYKYGPPLLCYISILIYCTTGTIAYGSLSQEISALCEQAKQYSEEEKYGEALPIYRNLIELVPNNAELYLAEGICAYKIGLFPEAAAAFERSIELNPHASYAHLHLISTFKNNKQYHEAFEACKRFLSIDPLHREGLFCAAIVAKELDLFEDAAWYFRTLYNHYPDDAQATQELAAVLVILEEYEEALELYTKALALNPTSLTIFYNVGFTLKRLGHLDDAIAIYNQILAQEPHYAYAHFSRGLAYLAQGNFKQGWPEYEWRWETVNQEKPPMSIPEWDGSSLNGKKIYVYAEQGLGDTFQFVRYLKILKEQGAYILFSPQAALKQFAKQIPYIDEIVLSRSTIMACDYQVALMSLPLLCNTTLETIPAEIPYLKAAPALVELWKPIFDALPHETYRIGICWHGNSQYKDLSLRRTVTQKSCPLALFKELATVPNVQLFSLQKVSGMHEIADLEDASFFTCFSDDIDTVHGRFMDTAAIITQLDLVITVDTAIAHLAAALGIKTWVLLPEPADWRWMIDKSDSPWYPNMRLFRQAKRGDWHTLMQEVKTEVAQLKKDQNNA